jgi:hypothetical protein
VACLAVIFAILDRYAVMGYSLCQQPVAVDAWSARASATESSKPLHKISPWTDIGVLVN